MLRSLTVKAPPSANLLHSKTLSFWECLSTLLNSDQIARSLIDRSGSRLPETEAARSFFLAMEVSPDAHLQGIAGLTPEHRSQLLAAFELARRYAIFRSQRQSRPAVFPTPHQLAKTALTRVALELRCEAQEWLGFVPTYENKCVGNLCIVERGVRTHVNIEIMELFARILALRPLGFYLFHNHPSGELRPSEPDREITENVGNLAAQLGTRLLGHAILTAQAETWINPCVRVRYDRDS